MTVTAVWHTGVHVADVERSIRFYRDLLGMRLVHRQEQATAYTGTLVGYPGAQLRIAQLALAHRSAGSLSTHDLELVEYVVPRGRPLQSERNRPGITHLAFAVTDITATYERLHADGVRFISPPMTVESGINTGGSCCYFLDPDDLTLELVQPPPRRIQPS